MLPRKTVGVTGGRRFRVVLRGEDTGYSVQCVELPQAISQGETKKEALANIKEAIELVLEHLEQRARNRAGKADFVVVV